MNERIELFTEIPTFVIDETRTRSDETIHKVGELDRGDYVEFMATDLMCDLLKKFVENLRRDGCDVQRNKELLTEAIKDA